MQIQERVYSIRETAGEHHGLVWMDEINGRVERQILPGIFGQDAARVWLLQPRKHFIGDCCEIGDKDR